MTGQESLATTERPPAQEVRAPQFSPRDLSALAMLFVASVIVTLNHAQFDVWLARYDVYTQFIPWYHYLGERLRQGDLPGWNPHQFSGTPFAGHPLSGWMYLPAMVSFSLFPVLTGFKVMVGIQLVIASLSTYVYARVLGMGRIAGLVAAVVFAFGPFVEWNTYTSLQFAQYATWIPLALTGIELASRAPDWPRRLVPWFLAGFAFSQMLGAWVGEGWIYSGLVIGGYIAFRTLIPAPGSPAGLRARLPHGLTTGAAVFAGAAALAAAGILPRLVVNMQSSLAGANYSDLGRQGILNTPWEPGYLVTQLLGMGTEYHFRAAGLSGAIVVLMILAPMLAWRRHAVPYFTILTLASLILTLDTTPLHELFYLIPQYEDLHIHDPWRVVALGMPLGPAMLAGAAVDALDQSRGHQKLLPAIAIPLVIVTALAIAVEHSSTTSAWIAIIPAAFVTLLAMIVVTTPPDERLNASDRWAPRAVLLTVAMMIFLYPTGLELTGSWLGWPEDTRWANRLDPDPAIAPAIAREVRETDPDGAGGYLQERLEKSGPFRYLGYGGGGHPDDGGRVGMYQERRFDPYIQAVLVNGRPIFMDLYEIQGYDPIQLERYTRFITAINGGPQDYHTALVLHHGVRSPLIDLLNVRYVLVSAELPPDREDVRRLTADYEEVARTDYVVVYEHQNDLPHAWIVHEVRSVTREETLPLLRNEEVDPYEVALVEGNEAEVARPANPNNDRVEVTRYDPEEVIIETSTDAAGFLVVSDIYEEGWRAWVNGEEVDIPPTHHALRGVPIPAGDATIEFRYDPLSLRVGVPLSAGTALCMLGIATTRGWQWWRDRSA